MSDRPEEQDPEVQRLRIRLGEAQAREQETAEGLRVLDERLAQMGVDPTRPTRALSPALYQQWLQARRAHGIARVKAERAQADLQGALDLQELRKRQAQARQRVAKPPPPQYTPEEMAVAEQMRAREAEWRAVKERGMGADGLPLPEYHVEWHRALSEWKAANKQWAAIKAQKIARQVDERE